MSYPESLEPYGLGPRDAKTHALPYAHLHMEQAAYGLARRGVGVGGLAPGVELAGDLPARPLRSVHVGPCFSRGGAEQQLIDLARFLDPRRVHLQKCLITRPHLIDVAVVADMPAPVEVGGAEAVRRAASEFDVLFFWGLPLDDWLAHCRPKLCLFMAHGESPWTRELLERSARVVDHVVAVSQRVQEKICQGFPSTIIPNGIDTARLATTQSRRDVRSALGFAADDFVLGYVGRFSPEKRPDLVIKTAALLPPTFKVLMVGWGPLEGELAALANQLIPGRFAFRRADRYLGDFYQALDALCLLSHEEGFALVVLEAMMCGRPVIATAVGSIPETVIDRVSGLIVSSEVRSVCQAARMLQEHPDWARGIAAEGRAYAQQYGHARRMARAYEQLVARLWEEKHADKR